VHNEAFSVVAMGVSNPDCSPFKAETQPQLQPALLRLSATISHCRFTERDSGCFALHTAMTK
jgi:hypothetical protein